MPNTRFSYKIFDKAQTDLTTIWEYTFGDWSAEQADRYLGSSLTALMKFVQGQILEKIMAL